MFIEGRVGYRFRTEAFFGYDTSATFVDGIPFGLKIGATRGRLTVLFDLDGYKNLPGNDRFSREYLAMGPTMLLTLVKGLAIEARFSGQVISNNAPQGISFGLGVSWRCPYPEG